MLLPAQHLSTLPFGGTHACFSTVAEAFAWEPDVLVGVATDKAMKALALRPDNDRTAIVAFQSDGPCLSFDDFQKADGIVTDSALLLSRVPAWHLEKTMYIPDTLEPELVFPTLPRRHPGQKLKCVWVGAGGNYFFAEKVVEEMRRNRWLVDVVTDTVGIATTPWSRPNQLASMNAADVGLVPYPENLRLDDARSFDNWLYKDNSRVALLQAMGLPVIASIHPAHVGYLQHGDTGLLANSIEDWVCCMNGLQSDAALYERLSEQGIEQAWRTASVGRTSAQWLEAITTAHGRRQSLLSQV